MENRLYRCGMGLVALVFVLAMGLTGCNKDVFNESPDFQLQFSTDSVIFDTVFTTIGSATQIMKVYNRSKDPVKISRINLANDPNDSYRINVDGLSGTQFSEVEIGAEDSMFIFIEVTVTPFQNELYPFVDGAIEFQTNGNTQSVKLVAWGWDAIFYYPDVFPTNGLPNFTTISPTPNTTVTWTPDRPIVVFGYVVVDSSQTLIVDPGTQVFFHNASGLWVYKDGRIEVNGTLESPVVFQGDRLEPFFAEEPGQWDRIWINEAPEGTDHVIKNALIKNNFIGIQLEPLPFGPNNLSLSANRIELENVAVRNNSIAGIFSRNYRIDAENLLLSRGGQFLLAATGAGEYRFDQCTFANNWNLGVRQSPAVFISNLFAVDENTVGVGPITGVGFRNCIIDGNNFNELGLEIDTDAPITFNIRDCSIKVEEETFEEFDPSFFTGSVYVNLNPGFVNFSGGDFRLSENAEAIGKGGDGASLPFLDIVGTPYNTPRPLGCFEFFVE